MKLSKKDLEIICDWLITNVFRNEAVMFDETIRHEDGGDVPDLPEVIASLFNMLYKQVTGEEYKYFFHWANKIGSWVEDDLFEVYLEVYKKNKEGDTDAADKN